MKLWKIKWENILLITLTLCMVNCWIVFLAISNVNTLAIASISTFMAIIVAFDYETLKEFRQEVLKNWK